MLDRRGGISDWSGVVSILYCLVPSIVALPLSPSYLASVVSLHNFFVVGTFCRLRVLWLAINEPSIGHMWIFARFIFFSFSKEPYGHTAMLVRSCHLQNGTFSVSVSTPFVTMGEADETR